MYADNYRIVAMTIQEFLAVPSQEATHFKRNFVRHAICELRFPTLFELEAPRPPYALSSAMRKDFPIYEFMNGINVNPGGVASANSHVFKSRKGEWAVSVRASAITIETFQYESFDLFLDRIEALVRAISGVIDCDFFTRIGMRMINAIPIPRDGNVDEWVNPSLVGDLPKGVFGRVNEFSQRIAGVTEVGQYLFQHGVGAVIGQPAMAQVSEGSVDYVLDFDFSSEDVTIKDTSDIVRKLHMRMYDLFFWSLGAKAVEYLGPSTR